MNHPVDRRGRCGSCRRPGAVLGRRRRRCRVHTTADYWLHHPDADFLLTHLAREFGLDPGPRTGDDVGTARRGATDTAAGDTDPLPRITTGPSLSQSPVVSSPPFLPGGFPRTRRPDPDHGEARETFPTGPWPRRGPSSAGSPPAQPRSLLLAGGLA